MTSYQQTKLNTVKRGANRASYDKEVVHEILDDSFLCHVAYVYEGRPVIIPTAYGREGETIYIHGAVANRMLNGLVDDGRASMTVTHLDGLVLARSGFHHSANFRSVSLFGTIRELKTEEEKIHSLKVIMEQMLPGRWEECRPPNEVELKRTLSLAIDIEYATAKIRKGGPIDDEEDYDSPYWAGQIPMSFVSHPAISDELLTRPIPIPDSVINHLKK